MTSIAICFVMVAFAQSENSCGTPKTDSAAFFNQPWVGNNQFLNNFLDSMGYPKSNTKAKIVGSDKVWYKMPIKIWNIRRDDGSGGINEDQIVCSFLRLMPYLIAKISSKQLTKTSY